VKRFVSFVLAGALTLALAAPANGLTKVPFTRPIVPGVLIACFHGGGPTARAHPARCHFGEYRGDEVNEVAVKNMKWGHWGAGRTRAALGVEVGTGARVRVIALRRIICADGSTWYSGLVVLDPRSGDGVEMHPPTCERATG
jgi:hypothetical protein